VGPVDNHAGITSYKRFHTNDNSTKTYYFASIRPATQLGGTDYPPLMNLYAISYGDQKGVLSNVTVNTTLFQNLSAIHFDPSTKTLYGLFENVLTTIDPSTGQVTFVTEMWTELDFLYNRISSFDSPSGRFFMSVHNYQKDTYHIATFDVTTSNFTLSPPVGFDKFGQVQNVPQGIAYNPGDGGVLLLCESRLGASFERFEPTDGSWVCLMPASNPEMQNWDAYDYTTQYGSMYVFNPLTNRFVVTVLDDSSGTAELADTIQFNPSHPEVDDINSSTTDFTNYIVDYD